MGSSPTYAQNCRHYRGPVDKLRVWPSRSNASCSFRIYGNPSPETPGGTIYAEGVGLTTEEVNAALLLEADRWSAAPWAKVTWTEGPTP